VEGVSRELPSSTSTGSESMSDEAMEVTEYQPPDPRTALPRDILEGFWVEGRNVLIWILIEELSRYIWAKFMPGENDERKLITIMKEKLGHNRFNLLYSENITMIGVLKLLHFYDNALTENMEQWSVMHYHQ